MSRTKKSQSLLLTSLFIAAALAGCTTNGTDDGAPTEPVIHTAPTDDGGLDEATATQVEHIHDYWGGQSEVVVADRSVEMGYGWTGDYLEDAGRWRLDEGAVVPQGTKSINVTVTLNKGPNDLYDRVELYVKTQNLTNPTRLVGNVTSGEPMEFEINLDDADLPHQSLSAWLFTFSWTRGTNPIIRVDSDVTVYATAHRGLPLPVFPPHPDQWNGTEAIHLMFDRHDSSSGRAWGQGSTNCLGRNESEEPSCFYEHVFWEGKIVPRSAHHVTIVMHQENDRGSVVLTSHGADTYTYSELTPDEDDGQGTTVYRLEIGGADADGPYSKQSLWQLFPNTRPDEGATPDEQSGDDVLFGNRYDGTYTLDVWVFRGEDESMATFTPRV